VFADFAIAARIARENGERVAILDIDAHHGDGTETLLLDSQEILTYSVHQWGIFPGTGLHDIPESQAYNTPLPAEAGNHELMMAVKRFITLCDEFQPSIVFIAAGADGAWFDPLSELRYTVDGMASSVRQVREQYPWMPILMGGAGGYLPDGGTPLAWGAMAGALI
jgi:acetoin utilization protein AcuC